VPNPYPADFSTAAPQTRLDGSITFTDPANQPGGGSGSVDSVTAGDASITVGGTAADPTVEVSAQGVTQAKIADGAVSDVQVAAANKDGLAAVDSMRTLGTGAQQSCGGADSRLSDARTPTGAAGGDLTGTYPNPTLGTFGGGAAGPIGDATHSSAVTVDAKGRVSALTAVAITGTLPGGTAGGDLSGSYPNPTVAAIEGVAVSGTPPSANQVLTASDATHAAWAAAGSGATTVTVFTAGAGQTFTKGGSTKAIEVICIGSGGQGGGGFSGSAAASVSGGGGGGGGAVTRAEFQASDVPSPTTVNVSAGGSGAGGPGAPANNGGDGAATNFGALLLAGGGGGGVGGKSATAIQGGSGGSVIASAVGITAPTFAAGAAVNGIGGQGSTTPAANNNGNNVEWGGASGAGMGAGAGAGKLGGSSIFGGAGGGAGGGSSTVAGSTGGAGGTTQAYTAGGGAAGGTAGNAGTSGTSFLGPYCGNGAGGGSSGGTGVTGKNGGVGGIGCGGGGGGASANTTGGTGGVGGAGRCIVIEYS
jgi:hypothetical protein